MISTKHHKYGKYPDGKGFFITGKDKEECMAQLREYRAQNPDQDIRVYYCGTRPGKPIPIPEVTLDIRILD